MNFQGTCRDCGDKIELTQDKYFIKKLSKSKLVIETLIKCIIPTIMGENTFETKIICESCNRNDKIKDLL